MRLERFEDRDLAQYSYAVVCEGARQAAIVDPRRDVDVYLRWADAEGLSIAHVLETHIHADFASGGRELAERTGAALHLSAHDEGEDYEVAFPHHELRDRDRVELGSVTLEARHTPGHTPEHLVFLVFDGARSREVPMAMLSGDFLFVGSLGRPDLLGEAATRRLAQRLHASVRGVLDALPDGLEVHPGHGAGSMCGAGMSARPVSTLGFERVANPRLAPTLGEAAFVERILSRVPPFPPYYRRMKRLNADGPPLLGELPGGEALPVERFRALVEAGHVVIDLRDQLAFGAGHVPGSLGIGIGGSLSTWAAWFVPYDTPLLLVAPDREAVEEAARRLVRVGLDPIVGHLDGGIDSWVAAGLPIADLPQIAPRDLAGRLEGDPPLAVLDVRTDAEWNDGHIAGAHHLMAGLVPERPEEVPAARPLAIVCGGGYRSTVVASHLQRQGTEGLINVTGGMGSWRRAGLPTVATRGNHR